MTIQLITTILQGLLIILGGFAFGGLISLSIKFNRISKECDFLRGKLIDVLDVLSATNKDLHDINKQDKEFIGLNKKLFDTTYAEVKFIRQNMTRRKKPIIDGD